MSVRACAVIAGCDHKTMGRWARSAGVVVLVAGKPKVSTEKLKAAFPDVYERVADDALDALDDM